MKRFLKCFSCYMVAVLIIASCVLFPVVGSHAATIPSDMIVAEQKRGLNTQYWTEDGELAKLPSGETFGGIIFPSLISVASYLDGENPVLKAGTYQVNGKLPAILLNLSDSNEYPAPYTVTLMFISFDGDTQRFEHYGFNEPIRISEDGYGFITYQSIPANANEVVVVPPTLYESAWDLFVKFVYGEHAEITPEQNLTLTILSTLAALLIVLIPFLLVWFVFRLVFRW